MKPNEVQVQFDPMPNGALRLTVVSDVFGTYEEFTERTLPALTDMVRAKIAEGVIQDAAIVAAFKNPDLTPERFEVVLRRTDGRMIKPAMWPLSIE